MVKLSYILFFLLSVSKSVLAQGPVAYFPFNGNANDESGNNNHGTVNGATPATDRLGNSNSAYLFNGTNSYIEIPSSIINGLSEYTFSFWINTTTTSNSETGLIAQNDNNNRQIEFTFKINELKHWVYNESGSAYISNTHGIALADGENHHIVITVGVGALTVYVDGFWVDTNTNVSGTIKTSSTDPIRIGAVGSIDFFEGVMDDVRIYDRVLATSEIQALYTEGGFAIADIDGNIYGTVDIGTQKWMTENLKAINYNDGTPLTLVTDNAAWGALTTEAYSWYNNDEVTYSPKYGALYNWYAVNSGNLCPTDWYMPTDADWFVLSDYLGGAAIAGGKLKETGTTNWTTPNTGATDEIGFTGRPGGKRDTNGNFINEADNGYWWSTTENTSGGILDRYLSYNSADIKQGGSNKKNGFAIRCFREINETNIRSFALAEESVPASIDAVNHTVDIEVAYGTDVTVLVPIFGLSSGAAATVSTVGQVSGTTANDFTNPVTYLVAAEDGTTTQNWTVTVTVDDGLVAHYPFSGDATDASGYGNDGTESGGVALTTDRFGSANSAYIFDGVDDKISLPFSAQSLGNAMTISAWVYRTKSNSSNVNQGIVSNDVNISDRGVMFGIIGGTGNDAINASFWNTSELNIVTGSSLPITTWKSYTITYDGIILKLFEDGALINSTTSTGIIAGTTNFAIGHDPFDGNAGRWFGGSLDDIRIYDRSLSPTEISNLYALESGIPAITSFTPPSGPTGTSVTITGTNFDATPANNIVFFGATQAIVTAATTTELTVTVPTGATYDPITVLANGLLAWSAAPFVVAFGGAGIDANSFDPKVDYTTGTTPYSVSIGDLDGDGKADLAVTNYASNTISIFRNTSTGAGTISYATKVDYATGAVPFLVSIGDLDADGKLDLAVSNRDDNTVSVFRNASTGAGNISFAAKVDYVTGANPRAVSIGDLDGDGKGDLAVVNFNSATISVFRNTSTGGGNISYAAKVDFVTGLNPQSVSIGDLDGDGKADLAVSNYGSSTVSVLRNIGISFGTISYATKVDYATGTFPFSVSIGDLDKDGKLDMAVANLNSNTVSVFRNTSASAGTISYDTKVDYATGTYPVFVSIGDIDGDGKADMAVPNYTSNTVSVFRNTGTSAGAISYATKVDYATGIDPQWVSIGDLDGDGKADLAMTNYTSNTVSVFRNVISSASSATDITAFSLSEQTSAAIIDAASHTVNIDVNNGTDLTTLAPTFTLSPGANATVSSIPMTSGITINDYTSLLIVTIIAEDGINTQDWIINVTVTTTPTISAFTPISAGNGTIATITGTNFTGATEVSFGGIPATSFTVNSDTKIAAIIGTGATGDVSVTTPDGTVSLPGFNFIPTPIINSVTPLSGLKGSQVVISGNNFSTTEAIHLTEEILTGGGVKIWKLRPSAESIGVGPEVGSDLYWPNDIDVSGVRPCMFNDEFIFKSGGVYEYNANGDIYAEPYMGIAEGCVNESSLIAAAPDAVDWTSGTHSFSFTEATTTSNALITVSGTGAFIGLPKAYNGGSYTTAPPQVDGTVTYEVTEYLTDGVNETLTLSIDVSNDGSLFWKFVLSKEGSNVIIPPPNSVEFNDIPATVTATTSTDLTVTVPTGATSGAITVTVLDQSVTSTDSFTVLSSSETDILGLTISPQIGLTNIDANAHTVVLEIISGPSLTNLAPQIELSNGATVSPLSDLVNDFTNPVIYTVTAEDGLATQAWQVTVNVNSTIVVSTLNDIDGNNYTTLKIGNQWWMGENLRTTKYADGSLLADGTAVGNTTADYTTKYRFSVDDIVMNDTKFGALYTWAAAMNGSTTIMAQGVCPAGWHLPSDFEWQELEMHLGMSLAEAEFTGFRGANEGGILKEVGLVHWNTPNTGATNEKGFRALSAGQRDTDGTFSGVGDETGFWASDLPGSIQAWARHLESGSAQISRGAPEQDIGFSVRCTKDRSSEKNITSLSHPELVSGSLVINNVNYTVDAIVNYGADLSLLDPTISISNFASIDPGSGSAQDFGGPFVYTVTAEDRSTQDWVVRVSLEEDITPPGFDLLIMPTVFESGTPSVNALANITDDLDLSLVSINYKLSNASGFMSQALTSDTDSYSYTLTENQITDIGLEYFFYAEDASGNTASTDTVQIVIQYDGTNGPTIPNLGTGGQPQDWRMFSIPFVMDNKNVASIFETPLGTYDKSKWRIFHYKNDTQGFVEYKNGLSVVERGKGYWFNAKEGKEIKIGSGSGPQNTNRNLATISLTPGWNQIGNPYTFNVLWQDVLDENGLSSVDIGPLRVTNNGTSLSDETILKEYTGAYVHNHGTVTETLRVPLKLASGGRIGNIDEFDNGWLASLKLLAGSFSNEISGFGMHDEARFDHDGRDRIRVPRFAKYIDASFTHPEYMSPNFARDVVSSRVNYTWEFTVSSNVNTETRILSWEIINPESLEELILVDNETGNIIDMMISSSYSYTANEDRKFKAIYGSKDYIIKELKGNPIALGENYPNPFSETTIIPFAIYGDQDEYQYAINIYSMDGKLITNVINNNGLSGSYTIEWDGKDKNGNRLSGLFIYSLEVMTDEGIKSFRKKMILH